MRRANIRLCISAAIVAIAATGCGPITPAGLLMKGGMWAAQKVAKKEFKKLKAKHDQEKADAAADDEEMPRERGHKTRRHDKHHD